MYATNHKLQHKIAVTKIMNFYMVLKLLFFILPKKKLLFLKILKTINGAMRQLYNHFHMLSNKL